MRAFFVATKGGYRWSEWQRKLSRQRQCLQLLWGGSFSFVVGILCSKNDGLASHTSRHKQWMRSKRMKKTVWKHRQRANKRRWKDPKKSEHWVLECNIRKNHRPVRGHTFPFHSCACVNNLNEAMHEDDYA